MSRIRNPHATCAVTLSIPVVAVLALTLVGMTPEGSAGQANGSEVTFTKDIAPILQRSCQNCHRPESIAPMSLLTYQDARRYATRIKERTQLRDRMGVMPPWFIEKDVGIQDFQNDISLSEEEIATIATWVDSGTPEGNPADMPSPRVFASVDVWDIGTPDLIVDLPSFTMEAEAPDWWGMIPPAPSGMTEDRYVAAMEVKEISDVEGGAGGQFIYHHAIIVSIGGRGGSQWPVHEVGRNAEVFDPLAAPLLAAGSQFMVPGVHLHANGTRTTAHLRLGFKFQPEGYEPTRRRLSLTFGNGEVDLRPMQAGQEIHIYQTLEQNMKITTFEPHLHAAGVRMCLEAIYGGRTETLTCAGYDHNWVKVYNYAEDAQPLLPRGTLLHVTAYFDTTPDNKNVVDPRNWGGLGHRSIDNMAIVFTPGLVLDDEQFAEEMAKRRERLGLAKGEGLLGCPLCGFEELPASRR